MQYVHVDAYNMTYQASNTEVVAPARALPEQVWESLPVVMVPFGTVLHANVEKLMSSTINKVVSGVEAFRDNYPTKLYRTDNGELHVVDGHHRVAMCAALHTDIPALIADNEFVAKCSSLSARR